MRLSYQRGEQAVFLAKVGQKMVVEEAGAELLVNDPAVQADGAPLAWRISTNGLSATRSRKVVPTGGRAVRRKRVELHQVDVEPALHRELAVVNRICRERAETVVMPPFDDVAMVGPREERKWVPGCLLREP